MFRHFSVKSLRPTIAWEYFFHAWDVVDKAEEQEALRHEAERLLDDTEFVVEALTVDFPARGDGDDIVVRHVRGCPCCGGDKPETRLAMLRQQSGRPPYLSLSDFVNPAGDSITLYATVCHVPALATTDDPYRRLLLQTLADRLAEAASEVVCSDGLGYAIGYPSLPDQSLIFNIAHLLPFPSLGIRLTSTGMMRPHASVAGILIHHPAARYFAVGPIGEEQLQDYARRRGVPPDMLRPFLRM